MSMSETSRLIGNEIDTSSENRTQVFQATHDREGNRLPYMLRSFISFTYGGKFIEDFNLICITENNSLDRNLTAQFTDKTSTPETVNGQFYWGTYFNKNNLKLSLFSDDMSEYDLDNFKVWFKPGVERELILAEHPFRAIIARVDEVSTLHMLPFEKEVKVIINGETCETSVTSYRGKITLSFVMDDPFWYSKQNVIDNLSDIGKWTDANGIKQNITSCKDAVKIMYEDRMPTQSMFTESDIETVRNKMTNGDLKTIGGYTSIHALVGSASSSSDDETSAHISGYMNGTLWKSWIGEIKKAQNRSVFTWNSGSGNKLYFYYAGTAPSLPVLLFSFTCNNNCFSNNYFSAIGNKYSSPSIPYSVITAEGVKKYELKITTPSILTAYNQAVKISNTNYVGLKEEAYRDGVHHKIIRDKIITWKSISTLKNWLIGRTFNFIIDCKTGRVKITYQGDNNTTIEEDAGDMIVSNNLQIVERNCFTNDGKIGLWDTNHEYSHILYHNLGISLDDVQFIYSYMYL